MTWIELDPDDLSAMAANLRRYAGNLQELGADVTGACGCELPPGLVSYVDSVVAGVRGDLATVSNGYAADAGTLDARAGVVQDEPLSSSAGTAWSNGTDSGGTADLWSQVTGAQPAGAPVAIDPNTVTISGGAVPSAFAGLVSDDTDTVAVGGDSSGLGQLTGSGNPNIIPVPGDADAALLHALTNPSPDAAFAAAGTPGTVFAGLASIDERLGSLAAVHVGDALVNFYDGAYHLM